VHLESGLSSGRLLDPFPEELCRRLVFRMTDVAMCPDAQTSRYMSRYRRVKVVNTHGNTISDSVALTGAARVSRPEGKPYIVASLHRFQNIYNVKRLRNLVALVEAVAKQFTVHFVLHPATRGRLENDGLLERLTCAEGVSLHPRMGYRDFLCKAAGAACVLTDGGSNQEELAVLGVPTIVMRTRSERPDGLGENAIMENDVPGTLEGFIVGNGFGELRRPSRMNPVSGPSSQIAMFLANDASDDL
jgi:UDP-N-acetylglucosamine 2-epimerase (non-hydrolysing)